MVAHDEIVFFVSNEKKNVLEKREEKETHRTAHVDF